MTIGNFGDPAINVSFPSIQDTLTGGRHTGILWNNVPVSDGAFSATYLSARVHGSNHEEVGGILPHDEAVGGVFGATRSQSSSLASRAPFSSLHPALHGSP